MTDQELIKHYLMGDTGAFNTLVRRYHKPIYNYLLKLTGSRDDADDLAQQVMIRCHKSLKRLKDHDRFGPWLYRIAANITKDHWRSRKDMVSFDNDSGEGKSYNDVLISEDDPYNKTAARDQAELLKKALLKLPLEQREVLTLKIYQGLKFTEIAEAVDAPLNTVKSRLYYGLSAMKKTLQSWNIEELNHRMV